ncbi:MAG: sugar transferase [Bacteroidales bacterium]|nr:sugar transferase [Bacteroidales bacterium]
MKGHSVSINLQRMRYAASDLLTTALAFFLFDICRYFIMDTGQSTLWGYLSLHKIVLEQILIPFSLLGVYWLSGYYNSPFSKSRLEEFLQTFSAAGINCVLIYFALLINDTMPTRSLSYGLILILFGLLFLCTYTDRLLITAASIRHFSRRDWYFNTVIIGDSDEAINIAKRLTNSQSNLGYSVIGHLPIEGEEASSSPHEVIDHDRLDSLISEKVIDQLIIVPQKTGDENKVLNVLFRYFDRGVPIRIAPSSISFLTSNIRMRDIIAEPFIDLSSPSMSEWQKNLKRVADVVISLLALILLSPLFLVLAVAVKRSSPGPVFYRQERIGYRQKPFEIIKFRSMREDAEKDGPQVSAEGDTRITNVGRIMRKYRLDEFPQFWNVLKGEMSLVGPRPEREYYIRQIVKEAPYYTLIHQVKPGITSWGMVKFGYARSVREMVERTRYDLIYLSNMSIGIDCKIILHTINTVISGKGV